jgi:hypothetical protein
MHPSQMFSRVRHYFEGSRLARMSDGTYCIIRDLGLVKGGKGMRHHEVLVTFSLRLLLKRIVRRGFPSLQSLAPHTGASDSQQITKAGAGALKMNELPATKS